MKRFAYFALILVGCDGATPSQSGPVQVMVDPSTNHQVAPAAERDSLPKPVDAVLYREPGGVLSFRLVTPAYAQTEVNGAPVPGAIVNAVGVGDCKLEPWNPSAITNAQGKARFFFEPGTKAGECVAEIRYTDGVNRIVTDTVVATVEPGPAHNPRLFKFSGIEDGTLLVFHPLLTFFDVYQNPIPFTIEASGAFMAGSRGGCGPGQDGSGLNSCKGILLAPGAKEGDKGVVTFKRGSQVILEATGIVSRPTPTTWRTDFIY